MGKTIFLVTIGAACLFGCATDRPRNEALAAYAEPEIVCKREAPSGSHIKQTVCHEHGGHNELERDRTFGRLHDLPMDRDKIH